MITTKKINRLAAYIVITAALLSACAGAQTSNTTTNPSGVAELDKIIDIVLREDIAELKSSIRFTQAKCSLAEGLGGPPKCLAREQEGTAVEVLPILGSEGHFLRKDDIESWDGVDASVLFAAYEVSEKAYSDENYPAGEYALIFLGKDKTTSITLQIDKGSIVRIDYGFNYPPTIREEEVVQYLVMPIDVNP